MKRRALLVVLVGLVLVLSGCDFFTSLFWPPVSLADAKEAWGAIGVVMTKAVYETSYQLDNGSDPNYTKWGNAENTIFYEARMSSGGYPVTVTFSASGFTEGTSGYKLDGAMATTSTSSTEGTADFEFKFSHDSKPVKSVKGTLNVSGATPSGSLKFNNDTFSYADFSAP